MFNLCVVVMWNVIIMENVIIIIIIFCDIIFFVEFNVNYNEINCFKD